MKKHLWTIAFVVAAALAAIEGVILWQMHEEKRRQEVSERQPVYASRQPAARQPRIPSIWHDPLWNDPVDTWDPFREMESMQRLMDRLFQDTYNRGLMSTGRRPGMMSYAPELDLRTEEGAYVATFDLPGLDKDKIDIKVQNRHLTVSGQREEEKTQTQDDGSYQRMERSFGAFTRSLPLPADASEEGITADTKNGVLTVRIPRLKDAAPAEKKIDVQ